jgi:hypothetical protein
MTRGCTALARRAPLTKDNGAIDRGPKSKIIAVTMCKRIQANMLRSDRYEFVVGRVQSDGILVRGARMRARCC